MSELKVIPVPKMTSIFGHIICLTEYYLKSEADKVIAEKDKEIAELKAENKCRTALQKESGGIRMIICDRCKKNPGRLFAYGDAINEAYEYADLCYECTKEIKELIWRYRKGDILEAKEAK